MSKTKAHIEVRHTPGVIKEAFAVTGIICQRCGGRGFFPATSLRRNEITICPDCRGTGAVRAMVTIEWERKMYR